MPSILLLPPRPPGPRRRVLLVGVPGRPGVVLIVLVQGGQGVFGIAVGRVWREVEGSLAEMPYERPEADEPAEHPADELAARRRARGAS